MTRAPFETPMSQNQIYGQVLQSLHTGVVIHAADTSIIFSNQRAAELLGLTESQMLGKTAIDPGWHFVNEHGVPMTPESYPVSVVQRTGSKLSEMVVGVVAPHRKDVVWVQVSAFPDRDANQALQSIVVNFHDISLRKVMEENLRTSERRYRTLFETVPQGVVYQDLQGRITSANTAALRILGLTEDQIKGRSSLDPRWKAIHEDGSDFPGHLHPTMEALRTGQTVNDVVMGVSAMGRDYVWLTCSATPLFEDGVLTEVYAIFEDITERKKLELQVRQLAFFDPLTRLPNRRLLSDRMAQALISAKRSGTMGALMVLDLDNFKPLNDAQGHIVGDLLLVEVARRLAANVREVDTVARFGGDEFVVVIRELKAECALSMGQARQIAEKIRVAMAEPYFLDTDLGGQPVRIEHRCSASIGVALFDAMTGDVAEVLKRADHAMYEAKREGRNRVMLAG